MITKKAIAASVAGLCTLTLGTAAFLRPAAAQDQYPGGHYQTNHTWGQQQGNQDDRHAEERHPELKRAMDGLRSAEQNLEGARHDYDGHRQKALDLIHQAMDEIHQAYHADRH